MSFSPVSLPKVRAPLPNLRQPAIATGLEVFNNANQTQDHCGEIDVTPIEFSALVHNNVEGFHTRANVTLRNYFAFDNLNFDLGMLEGTRCKTQSGNVDDNKTRRVAA